MTFRARPEDRSRGASGRIRIAAFGFAPIALLLQDTYAVTPESAPIDWFPLLVIVASGLVMVFLARRAMRGMNQQDWILLRKARSTGADLRTPQSVAFVVFAATEDVGKQLAAKMQAEGYETAMKQAQIQFARGKRKPGAPQDGWLVSGTRSVLLVPDALKEIRKKLTEMATEHKALYLGWQLAATVAPLTANAQTGAGDGQAGNREPAPDRPKP